MKISLRPAGATKRDIAAANAAGFKTIFAFSMLPESIQVRGAASYQSFDIITKGAVKVPKGTDVTEISWDGEFFGESKKEESLIQTKYWEPPKDCVERLNNWMNNGTELTLIVSGTWINMDVTIASFETEAYGAYGNVKYSIKFCRVKNLKIYTTKESKKKKKTRARSKKKAGSLAGKALPYVVKKGDTLNKIAKKHGCTWQALYNKNKSVIEKAAQKHGKKNSDKGRWIYPGTKLTIP